MRRNNKNLNIVASLAIDDVVGKAQYSIKPNARGKLRFLGSESKFAQPKAGPEGSVLCTEAKLASDPNNRTNLDHCHLEGSKIAGAESMSLFLVIGDVLKVFNPRCLTEEVAHFSKAWA